MKQILLLRTLSVTAAAFCAALLITACGAPAGVSEVEKPKKAALKLLELSYSDAAAPDGFIFDSAVTDYTLNIEKEYEGDNVTIKATAEAGSNITAVTVDGVETGNNGIVSAPKTGEPSKIITVSVSAGTDKLDYKITLETPQSTSKDDDSLKSVHIGYELGGKNLISFISGQSGTAKVDNINKRTAVVEAIAGSSESTVEIIYKGEIKAAAAQSKASATINLPAENENGALEIIIHTANGAGKTYNITIMGYVQKQVTWYGTVEYVDNGQNFVLDTVTVMNSAKNSLPAIRLHDIPDGFKWYIEAGEFFWPASMTVSLKQDTGATNAESGLPIYKYSQSKSYTLKDLGRQNATAAETEGNPLALHITSNEIGSLIKNANDLFTALSSTDVNANYALGSNIDLTDYKDSNGVPIDWPGADRYAGKFYGNGYTIKLELAKKTGDTGLFNTLNNGAHIEGFTIDVTTKEPFVSRTGNSHFGGVVGYISDTSAEIMIRDVTVKGSLEIGSTNNYYYLGGGLLGEVKKVKTLNIENCASFLTITVKSGANSSAGGDLGIGGLIGRIRFEDGAGTVNVANSYATGDVIMESERNAKIFAGGLIGDILTVNDKDAVYTVNVNNSYASGEVSVSAAAASTAVNAVHSSGGLIGVIYSLNTTKPLTVNITNCAAINEKAYLYSVNTTNKSNGRFAGYIPFANSQLTLTLTGNIARSGMLIGDPAHPETDDKPDAANEPATAQDAIRAAGKTEAELKSPATWEALNWDSNIWDLSGVSSGKWPMLKTSSAK